MRADLDRTIKSIEFDRREWNNLKVNDLKSQLEKKFKVGNLGMRYNLSDGKALPLYQDHQLAEVLKVIILLDFPLHQKKTFLELHNIKQLTG